MSNLKKNGEEESGDRISLYCKCVSCDCQQEISQGPHQPQRR